MFAPINNEISCYCHDPLSEAKHVSHEVVQFGNSKTLQNLRNQVNFELVAASNLHQSMSST